MATRKGPKPVINVKRTVAYDVTPPSTEKGEDEVNLIVFKCPRCRRTAGFDAALCSDVGAPIAPLSCPYCAATLRVYKDGGVKETTKQWILVLDDGETWSGLGGSVRLVSPPTADEEVGDADEFVVHELWELGIDRDSGTPYLKCTK